MSLMWRKCCLKKTLFIWQLKHVKKMSAEAADREAVTGSRPSTPPQTSWFEFILDESLLEKHLQKPNPGVWPLKLTVCILSYHDEVYTENVSLHDSQSFDASFGFYPSLFACDLCRSITSAACYSVSRAGLQALCEWAKPGTTTNR